MKNLFILLAFVGISKVAKTQGNLQFNQVKLVSTVETVPVGKVWKITSVIPTNTIISTTLGGYPVYECIIFINGNSRSVGHTGIRYGNGWGFSAAFSNDIWLPAGTTLSAGAYVGEISIIEFNIIP